MKLTLVLLLNFLMATFAMATDDLSCRIAEDQYTGMLSKSFKLINIDDKFPGITNFDGGPFFNSGNNLTLVYSNQCDNWMETAFPEFEYRELKHGKIFEITGTIFYLDSDVDVVSPDGLVFKVTCRIVD